MSAITRPSSTNSPRSVCEHQLAHLLPQSIPTYCMRASFESDCVTKRHIVDTSEALIHEIPVAPSISTVLRQEVTRQAPPGPDEPPDPRKKVATVATRPIIVGGRPPSVVGGVVADFVRPGP